MCGYSHDEAEDLPLSPEQKEKLNALLTEIYERLARDPKAVAACEFIRTELGLLP
jgi:hypothetical protein